MQRLLRNQEFRGNLIAKLFDFVVWRQQPVEDGQTCLADKEVGYFVQQGKDLSGDEVGAIYKDERSDTRLQGRNPGIRSGRVYDSCCCPRRR